MYTYSLNMKKSPILDLYRAKNSVFSTKDLALLWGETNPARLKTRIYRYVKAGKLYHIKRGFYAKDENYNEFELAVRMYTPSYISFETVLCEAGAIFQFYKTVFIASYLNRQLTIDGNVYSYRKIKDSILTHSIGLNIADNYTIASPERAFLDTLYLNASYHFDNVSVLDWEKVFEILPIYSNKRLEKEVNGYFKNI